MFKYIILGIFIPVLYGNLMAQEDFGVLYWTEDRDLSWEDFSGVPLPDSENDFFLDLHIESITNDVPAFFIKRRYHPKVYVFTKTSYAPTEIRSAGLLRYFNLYYDLAAYYSYLLQERLIKARNSNDDFYRYNTNIIVDAIKEEWQLESKRLASETQNGQNSNRLIYWESELRSKLDSLSTPIYEKSDYSCTFDLTVGALIGLQDYTDYLSQPVAVALGLEVAKAPFTYNFGLTSGSMKVKQSFSDGEDFFVSNTEPNLLNLYMHLGYQLVDAKYIRVVPRAGIHFSHLRYPEDDNIESSHWSISYTASMMIDFKLNGWNGNANQALSYSEFVFRIGTYYYPIRVGNANISNALVTAGLAWTFGGIDARYE